MDQKGVFPIPQQSEDGGGAPHHASPQITTQDANASFPRKKPGRPPKPRPFPGPPAPNGKNNFIIVVHARVDRAYQRMQNYEKTKDPQKYVVDRNRALYQKCLAEYEHECKGSFRIDQLPKTAVARQLHQEALSKIKKKEADIEKSLAEKKYTPSDKSWLVNAKNEEIYLREILQRCMARDRDDIRRLEQQHPQNAAGLKVVADVAPQAPPRYPGSPNQQPPQNAAGLKVVADVIPQGSSRHPGYMHQQPRPPVFPNQQPFAGFSGVNAVTNAPYGAAARPAYWAPGANMQPHPSASFWADTTPYTNHNAGYPLSYWAPAAPQQQNYPLASAWIGPGPNAFHNTAPPLGGVPVSNQQHYPSAFVGADTIPYPVHNGSYPPPYWAPVAPNQHHPSASGPVQNGPHAVHDTNLPVRGLPSSRQPELFTPSPPQFVSPSNSTESDKIMHSTPVPSPSRKRKAPCDTNIYPSPTREKTTPPSEAGNVHSPSGDKGTLPLVQPVPQTLTGASARPDESGAAACQETLLRDAFLPGMPAQEQQPAQGQQSGQVQGQDLIPEQSSVPELYMPPEEDIAALIAFNNSCIDPRLLTLAPPQGSQEGDHSIQHTAASQGPESALEHEEPSNGDHIAINAQQGLAGEGQDQSNMAGGDNLGNFPALVGIAGQQEQIGGGWDAGLKFKYPAPPEH
ncbi:hypothetical protein J7T55_005714 [Diaporthe amygdali]|uniref:uncharacterized protein n=1 Tax=Phomopsis amygdali TaxID=1214568 RepID=UPI0022FE8F91|nr:uncharacterized protein J7T55_005714 [Diaporthe amygdali]KAJ0124376.1 hypothetical protein J7T55_005714 [Diaporthe amygdali]